MSESERMIDKVTKLLAKAESTTPEEAEALFEKAAELMQRYAIDDAMLASAGKLDDEVVQHRLTFRGSYDLAQFDLGCAVGRGFGFRNIEVTSWDKCRILIWVGWKRDVEKAELVLASLLIQQAREVKAFTKATPPPSYATAFERFVYRRSHMIGFASGVGHKLTTARRVAQDSATRDRYGDNDQPSVSLVLVDRDARVKAAVEEMFNDLRDARPRDIKDSRTARAAGYDAGRRANTEATGIAGPRGALR